MAYRDVRLGLEQLVGLSVLSCCVECGLHRWLEELRDRGNVPRPADQPALTQVDQSWTLQTDRWTLAGFVFKYSTTTKWGAENVGI